MRHLGFGSAGWQKPSAVMLMVASCFAVVAIVIIHSHNGPPTRNLAAYMSTVGWRDTGLAQVSAYENMNTSNYTVVMIAYYPERFSVINESVQRMQHAPSLKEFIIIWNNLEKEAPTATSFGATEVPLRIVLAKANTLLNRYDNTLMNLTTDCVMYVDDDIVIPTDGMEKTFAVWKQMPGRIVGGYQKSFRPDFNNKTHEFVEYKYLFEIKGPWKYSILAPGAGGCVHRKYLDIYMSDKYKPARDHVLEKSECDDIFLNMIMANENNLSHVFVKNGAKDFDSHATKKVGLYYLKGRKLKRHECINWFVKQYGRMPLKYQDFITT